MWVSVHPREITARAGHVPYGPIRIGPTCLRLDFVKSQAGGDTPGLDQSKNYRCTTNAQITNAQVGLVDRNKTMPLIPINK